MQHEEDETVAPITEGRYQKAYEEWSLRVGSAEVQLKNWRIACILSMLMVIILSVCLYLLVSLQDQRVYVVEVKPGERVTHLQTLPERATPTNAQEAYFIGQFLQYTMTLPLDPVLARENWLNAYKLVDGAAVQQLTNYAKAHNPFEFIGVNMQSVRIEHYHPVSNRSYEVTWVQTTYDAKGQVKEAQLYQGIFTLSQGEIPKIVQDILINPLGLKVSYFTFSKQGEGS